MMGSVLSAGDIGVGSICGSLVTVLSLEDGVDVFCRQRLLDWFRPGPGDVIRRLRDRSRARCSNDATPLHVHGL